MCASGVQASDRAGTKPGQRPISPVTSGAKLTRHLIVHADDFGETPEVTLGICRAIEAGVVTSTSIMANMPGTQFALQQVAGLSDRASFGVHLNLCEGPALTNAPSLTDSQGRFRSKREQFARALTGRLARHEIEGEVIAQIARVRDAGVHISHVDAHKHLHHLPIVRDVVATVLQRFGIARIRVARLRSFGELVTPATVIREAFAWQSSVTFRRACLRSPARVLDLQTVIRFSERDNGARMRLGSCDPIELFCHPGTARADIEKPGSCRRGAELAFLLSARFQEWLSANRARLISYWDL